MDGRGDIVTNRHVVSNATKVKVTFSDWTEALRPGTPQAAPSNTQFTPGTTAANLAAQQAAALLPLPPRPGATQQFR